MSAGEEEKREKADNQLSAGSRAHTRYRSADFFRLHRDTCYNGTKGIRRFDSRYELVRAGRGGDRRTEETQESCR